jgi:hypothetical protein
MYFGGVGRRYSKSLYVADEGVVRTNSVEDIQYFHIGVMTRSFLGRYVHKGEVGKRESLEYMCMYKAGRLSQELLGSTYVRCKGIGWRRVSLSTYVCVYCGS